ncbi:unnamed protein product [Trichogramma brassicae]|uniref:Peptidoglycan-recognition protein n=1 Tax=Trichogramma brassicae TaxID=86971 RepID=A0A6H5ILI3_9HYME|nr:unnamed protein product [Trichogramma brassicae]
MDCKKLFLISRIELSKELVINRRIDHVFADTNEFGSARSTLQQQRQRNDNGKDVRIISRAEWGALEPAKLQQQRQSEQSRPRPLKVQPAPYALIGHTATQSCYNEAKCQASCRLIQTFHIEAKGWLDVGYNFLVGGDGNVYEGRGWDQAGAHTHNYNNRSLGLALVGDFTFKTPPLEQLEATLGLLELAVARDKLARDYKLLGQRQVAHTSSPGDKLFNVIRTWEHWSESP